MNNKCIICGSEKNKIIFKENSINILRCSECFHVYSEYESDQYFDGYFNKIDDDYWWNDAHQAMYDDFCRKYIKNKKGKLLDIGCGLGFFVKKITEHEDWEAFGYEISPIAAEYARNKLGLKNIYQGIVENNNFSASKFNIITLWDVIEHLKNPDPILATSHNLLKEDGILFIHTPNINIQLPKAKLKKAFRGMKSELHYLEPRDHLNIYSPKTIKLLLKRNGFGQIKFIHLKPIQSISGSKNKLLRNIKNLWFYASKYTAKLFFNKINLDNLFVIAKKSKSMIQDH